MLAMNTLFGIDMEEGPLYFTTSAVKDKLKLVIMDHNSPTELSSGIFYNLCYNTSFPSQDLVKNRNENAFLKEHLNTSFSNDDIWSSFLLCSDENSFQNGFTIKFKQNSNNDPEECTKNVLNIAMSLGLVSISKLFPNEQGFLVDVISCDTKEAIDHFEMLSVKYPGHYPMFDFGHSIYKSLKEIQDVLDLANIHTSLPEIYKLKDLANNVININPGLTPENSLHPFIVVEGLDAVGKSTLVSNLAKQIDAEKLHTPPSYIGDYREIFTKQCQPVRRAFYALGNYLIAEDIKRAMMKSPVVLDRYYYSTAAYAIAIEAKCGDESNIPPKGHPVYDWPGDLLKPSVVIFLTLSEKERKIRLRNRGYPETNEEAMLGKSQLLRRRIIAAYQNMNDPPCIIIDASKSKEEVCEDVMTSLRKYKILT